MTFQRKSALMMFLLGSTLLLASSLAYYYAARRSAIEQARSFSTGFAKKIACSMDLLLQAKSQLVNTMASTPLLRQALIQTNSSYAGLTEAERQERIDDLNERWRAAQSTGDPLVQGALGNPAADYLRRQQTIFPGDYGEIFVTDRYGALVASTAKLTTFAHAHKYWWKASYKSGEGTTFFDDRGYDTSVGGYVLGVVVPIRRGDEIVGILKANLSVTGALTDALSLAGRHDESRSMRLVRTGGLLVLEEGKQPLSTRMPGMLVDVMQGPLPGSLILQGDKGPELIAYAPVRLTHESDEYAFGGSPESIDHTGGNEGEGWHVIRSQPLGVLLRDTEHTTRAMVAVGLIFGLAMAVGAWMLSRNLARPLTSLVEHSARIGRGDFDAAVDIAASDELGTLGRSFNSMARELSQTMISRDLLIKEAEKRERAQEELRESEEKYKTLFESAGDALFIMRMSENHGARLVDCNEAALRLFGGMRREQILGRLPEDVSPRVQPDGRASRERARDIAKAVMEGQPQVFEWTYSRLDGTPFHVEVNQSRIGIKDELFMQAVVRDLTDRKRAEEERRDYAAHVQHSQRLESLGVLAGGVAHDFNNLLVGMLGHSDLALSKLPAENPARPHIEGTMQAAERAADLSRQMLAYSGHGHFVVQTADLSTLVRENVHLLKAGIAEGVQLRTDLSETPAHIKADIGQIQQVIMNLVINGAEAIGERPGHVTISTGFEALSGEEKRYSRFTAADLEAGRYVFLEVRDDGPGMDEETLSRIFDPFFTTKFVGRGLGLSALLGIVRGHKGGIDVQSEPGKGATFRLVFPATDEALEATKVVAAEGSLEGTILVIDDEQTVRKMASEMLTPQGMTVLTAEGGAAGLALYKEKGVHIRLVLLDYSMPEMGGEETFRELRKVNPDVSILLSSGFGKEEATRRFEGRNLTGFIQKPYRLAALLAEVRRCLAQRGR